MSLIAFYGQVLKDEKCFVSNFVSCLKDNDVFVNYEFKKQVIEKKKTDENDIDSDDNTDKEVKRLKMLSYGLTTKEKFESLKREMEEIHEKGLLWEENIATVSEIENILRLHEGHLASLRMIKKLNLLRSLGFQRLAVQSFIIENDITWIIFDRNSMVELSKEPGIFDMDMELGDLQVAYKEMKRASKSFDLPPKKWKLHYFTKE